MRGDCEAKETASAQTASQDRGYDAGYAAGMDKGLHKGFGKGMKNMEQQTLFKGWSKDVSESLCNRRLDVVDVYGAGRK